MNEKHKTIAKRIAGIGIPILIIAGVYGYQQTTKNPPLDINVAPMYDKNDVNEGNINAKHHVIVYESLTCIHCADFNKEYINGQWQKDIYNGKLGITYRAIARNYPDLIMDNVLNNLPADKKLNFIKYVYTHQEAIENQWDSIIQKAKADKKKTLDNTDVAPVIKPILDAILTPMVDATNPTKIKKLEDAEIVTLKAMHFSATPTIIYDKKYYDIGKVTHNPLNPEKN